MSLKEYQRKRNFKKTPEPKGDFEVAEKSLRFVIQKHQATRLHYDLRLEFGGAYKSWAVPKGPTLNASEQRLAVHVEDHPLSYGDFEGVIPAGQYGSGTVMIWDRGTFTRRIPDPKLSDDEALIRDYTQGKISVVFAGTKLRGEFALVRLKDGKSWLLVKKRDRFANLGDVLLQDRSVTSGRTMEEIRTQAPAQGAVWESMHNAPTPEVKGDLQLRVRPEDLAPARKKQKEVPERFPFGLTKLMLPLQMNAPFTHRDWLFSPDLPGYRSLAQVCKGSVKLLSKSGIDYTRRFPMIVRGLKEISRDAILEGTILKTPDGAGKFSVSDVLHHDGNNVREWSFAERRKLLKHLLPKNKHLTISSFVADQKKAMRAAQKAQVHFLLAKHKGSIYAPGRSYCFLRFPVPGNTAESSPTSKTDTARSAPLRSKDTLVIPGGPTITHTSKVFWPEEGITKGDLYEYYAGVSGVVCAHLKDRPLSLNRHPHGITGKSFYQKDVTGYVPPWFKTFKIESQSSQRTINYALCQNEASLFYLVNLGCIEINAWLSRIKTLDHPDYVVIDLDPDTRNPFVQVVDVAQAFRKVLSEFKAPSFIKTSGASGMHIFVPVKPRYTYELTRSFANLLCQHVQKQFPEFTSIVREPAKRRGKIYLDFMQNRRGSTMASPYCVRPHPGAPVSTPLHWDEVTRALSPAQFTIFNTAQRLRAVGDPWQELGSQHFDLVRGLQQAQDL